MLRDILVRMCVHHLLLEVYQVGQTSLFHLAPRTCPQNSTATRPIRKAKRKVGHSGILLGEREIQLCASVHQVPGAAVRVHLTGASGLQGAKRQIRPCRTDLIRRLRKAQRAPCHPKIHQADFCLRETRTLGPQIEALNLHLNKYWILSKQMRNVPLLKGSSRCSAAKNSAAAVLMLPSIASAVAVMPGTASVLSPLDIEPVPVPSTAPHSPAAMPLRPLTTMPWCSRPSSDAPCQDKPWFSWMKPHLQTARRQGDHFLGS